MSAKIEFRSVGEDGDNWIVTFAYVASGREFMVSKIPIPKSVNPESIVKLARASFHSMCQLSVDMTQSWQMENDVWNSVAEQKQ